MPVSAGHPLDSSSRYDNCREMPTYEIATHQCGQSKQHLAVIAWHQQESMDDCMHHPLHERAPMPCIGVKHSLQAASCLVAKALLDQHVLKQAVVRAEADMEAEPLTALQALLHLSGQLVGTFTLPLRLPCPSEIHWALSRNATLAYVAGLSCLCASVALMLLSCPSHIEACSRWSRSLIEITRFAHANACVNEWVADQ